MIRYLNQDLVRLKRNGKIHQLHYPKAIVEFEKIDWRNRITLFKDNDIGKIVFASPIPPPNTPFISFPIAIDSHYTEIIPIITEIKSFLIKYSIQTDVDFKLYPHISCKILERYDIPLSRISKRTIEVFGDFEDSLWERSHISTHKNKKQEYKQIIAKGVAIGQTYRVGDTLPYKTLTAIDSMTDIYGQLKHINMKGVKEYEQLKELEVHKNELTIDLSLCEGKLYEIEESIMKIVGMVTQLSEDLESGEPMIRKVSITLEDIIISIKTEGIEYVRDIEDLVKYVDMSIIVKALESVKNGIKNKKNEIDLLESIVLKLSQINEYYLTSSKVFETTEYNNRFQIETFRNIMALQELNMKEYDRKEKYTLKLKEINDKVIKSNKKIFELKNKISSMLENNEKRKKVKLAE